MQQRERVFGSYALRWNGQIKVGGSGDIRARLAQHRSYLPGHEFLGVMTGVDEMDVHARLSGRQIGKLDWFADTPENLAVLASFGLNKEGWVVKRKGYLAKKTGMRCLHCGNEWSPRLEIKPVQCPRCKSPRWDEEKRRSGRPRKSLDKNFEWWF